MPGKRKPRVTAQKSAPGGKAKPLAIDRARSEAMAAIARQRGLGDNANTFLDKAHSLLTRHWVKADWTAREELLKTADWLIQIAAAHPAPPGAGLAPEKKR
jgi:hypothetical protein